MSLPVGSLPHRAPASAVLAFALAASLALVGCKSHKGPQVSLRVAAPASPGTARCNGSLPQAGATLSAPVSKLRITLRARSSDGKTVDFCDRVFNFPGQPPFISVPDKGAALVDVFAEAYAPAQAGDPMTADGVRKVATGALFGVSPNAASLATLRLYPTQSFACSNARLAQARAFHTATLLPDGRVLLDGGLVASAEDATAFDLTSAGAYVTGGAEVYDPRDQSVHPVDERTPPRPRAFHAAQLLDGNGPCAKGQLAILLVGGFTNSPGVGQPIFQSSHGLPAGRLWPEQPSGALYNDLDTRAIGNEVLCLDPTTLAGTRMELGGQAAGFRAAGAGPHGLVAAGGIDYDPTMLNVVAPVVEVASFAQDGALSATAVGLGRTGASLTVLNTSDALVWGGGGVSDPIGEYLTGLDAAPSSSSVTATGTGTAITQFHTATLLAGTTSPEILVTGGFESTSAGIDTQPVPAASAVRLVTVQGTTVTTANVGFGGTYVADATCTNPTARYKPAGWEAATPLSRGRVLVSGGSPSTIADTAVSPPRCADCPGEASLLCAIGQASLYDAAAGTLSPTGALSVPRFGHTSTQLLDGSVLVAGGIGADTMTTTTTTVFLSDLEVYNPTATLAPYSSSTVLDLDDPIYADLVAEKLHREPAKLAVDPSNAKTPAHECGAL